MPTTDIKVPPPTELSEEAADSIIRLSGFFKKLRFALKPGLNAKTENALAATVTSSDIPEIKKALITVFKEADFSQAISGSGIPLGSSFLDEMLRIVKGKILPYLHDPKDACTIIHEIFNDSNDHDKIAALLEQYKPESLFTEVEKKEILAAFVTQITNSVHILSYRIAALGVDEDVYTRAGKDDALVTPFLEQNHEIAELLNNIEKGNSEKIAEDLAQTKIMIAHCLQNIALIDKSAEVNGTSLRQTFLLRKLELLIARLTSLLPIISYEDSNKAFDELAVLLRQIIIAETRPQKLRDFVSRNINLIAFRITENKRKTGEHYVASNNTEYWDLFIAACGGGFIVSFMVIIKLYLHEMHLPMLWENLLYSINYAAGFVVVQMLHFSIATKQPAMTAAYLAASLDDIKDDASRYHHLAITVARVSRSQLVSFIGNLLIVFPCALVWIIALTKISGKPFIEPAMANELLMSNYPLHVPLFWYASLAGAFLFLAGIISGFGDNKVVVSKIGLRIEAHPFLKKRMSATSRQKLASYIEKNLGPLLGNISVGFMLGMAGFFGKITGLPFDIRHITFATGNIALGLYGLNFHVGISTILAALAGIFIIGVFNFIVSFFLAIQVAARSRGLHLKDYPEVTAAILMYFKNHPAHFFFPERKSKEVTVEADLN
jgi:site-specific recombinase